MNNERKYVAISIKHTNYNWKFGDQCVLWGWRQTEDDQPRCFSDYTIFLEKAERYALGDFKKHGYSDTNIKDDEPVSLGVDFCKRYKNYDTVLVYADQYYHYAKFFEIPTQKPEEATECCL